MMLSITFIAGQAAHPASMSNRGVSFMNRFVQLKKKHLGEQLSLISMH